MSKSNMNSETIEPTMAYIMGKKWQQVLEAQGKHAEEDAWQSLWYTVTVISHLSVLCDCSHFSVASSNNRIMVASQIRDKYGVNPFKEWKGFG